MPEKPFTYPPAFEVSTSKIETNYLKVTLEYRPTYLSPVETSAEKKAIEGTPKR